MHITSFDAHAMCIIRMHGYEYHNVICRQILQYITNIEKKLDGDLKNDMRAKCVPAGSIIRITE